MSQFKFGAGPERQPHLLERPEPQLAAEPAQCRHEPLDPVQLVIMLAPSSDRIRLALIPRAEIVVAVGGERGSRLNLILGLDRLATSSERRRTD